MNLPTGPYGVALKVGLACLFVLGVWAHGRSSGKEAERSGWEKKVAAAQQQRIATYEQQLTKFRQQASIDQAAMRSLGDQVLSLEAERRKLESVKIPVVVKREVVPNAQGKCFDSRLSDAFGVCVSAAITGAAADSAACQAYRSDARAGDVERR